MTRILSSFKTVAMQALEVESSLLPTHLFARTSPENYGQLAHPTTNPPHRQQYKKGHQIKSSSTEKARYTVSNTEDCEDT
jgi:hypothetical protein